MNTDDTKKVEVEITPWEEENKRKRKQDKEHHQAMMSEVKDVQRHRRVMEDHDESYKKTHLDFLGGLNKASTRQAVAWERIATCMESALKSFESAVKKYKG